MRRRDFLKSALSMTTLGNLVFTPYYISSAQPVRAESPNDKIRIGAIGTSCYAPGTWPNQIAVCDGRGTTIARQAAELGEMVAVADVDRKHVDYFAQYFEGKIKKYEDYHEILADPSIDAVTIGTPDHWHVKIAIDAMKAGKDVYVEKPLTLTIDEGRLIAEAVKKTGRVVQVGTQQRTEYDGAFLKAAAICQTGRLGKIKSIRCTCEPPLFVIGEWPRIPFKTEPVPEGFNYEMWLGQAPVVDYFPKRCHYNFRWWKIFSGGGVTDWGVHQMDIVSWVMGVTEPPEEITATGVFPNVENWCDVPEFYDAHFKYKNGVEVQLITDKEKNEVIITGERGRIRVNRKSLTGKPVEILTAKDEEELNGYIHEKLMRGKEPGSHMRNFFECMRDRSLPVSDVFSHLHGVNACHLANIAIDLGRTLHWDHKNFKFVNDPEADTRISRKQREPYTIEI